MKAAFSAPRGVWITIVFLPALNAINDFCLKLQHHPVMSSEQTVYALGESLGAFIGGVFLWWVLWVAVKGTWLGICRLFSRQKPA
jgi:hypothetical protein